MMFKRLVIISCCALGGFAFGRWLSPVAGAGATEQRKADSRVGALDTPVRLPPPERAGRVPFGEIYRSLRSSDAAEHTTYLHSLQALPDGPDRRAALTAFFQCMASVNPQEAMDLVRQVGKDDLKQAVEAVLGATATPYTPGLVKMLVDLPAGVDPQWRKEKLKDQMFCWAAIDLTAATQFAEQYQSIYPDLAAGGMLQCLAAADPAAAERWLKEHADLSERPEVRGEYILGLYQNDPANARRYLAEHATEKAVQPSLKTIARRIFLSSADDGAEFINHLPAKEARQLALGAVLNTNVELFVNSENSKAALSAGLADWVTKFSVDDWPTTMSWFLGQWREFDPDGSMSWMANLPSPTRSAIAREFVRGMSSDRVKQVLATTTGDFHRDVLAAFATSLPPADDEREVAIEALELSPEDAAQLAAMR